MTDQQFTIPTDLASFSLEKLDELHREATTRFEAAYAGGTVDLEGEKLAELEELVVGIESIEAVQAERREAEAKAAKVGEFAARKTAAKDETPDEDEKPADVAAAEKRRGTLANDARAEFGSDAEAASRAAREASVLHVSGEGLGFGVGEGVTFDQAGHALESRLRSFNLAQYQNAASNGRHLREVHALATVSRNVPDSLMLDEGASQERIDAVVAAATDAQHLPSTGDSLVAAGGWCAPSETMYDLLELETSEGLLSLPEVGIRRGGLRFTKGPDFSTLYSQITGFSYTEEQDEAGTYGVDANGIGNGQAGEKPCVKVDCPDWEEYRLEVDGLCISAGLLASRAYPEMLARTIRGALVAHRHRMSARNLATMAAGSTAVTMPSTQAGAAAPLLTAIELQVQHYRYSHRLSQNAVLEAIFPFWVHGVIRSDLSRRLGVDLIDVTDARIDGWFRARGVNPQFVYDWQALDAGTSSTGKSAEAFTAWPTEVSFLLYSAGTWLRGVADLISVDSLYDSQLLKQNDFIALFTEEAQFVAKRGFDSRVVKVGLEGDGATHMGVDIKANGTYTVA